MAVSASSRKKAIVRKFSRDWQTGYVSPQGFARGGQLEILDMSGKVLTMSLEDIKWVCFVREFPAGDDPERLMRRTFTSRPRTPGVWLRMKLRDGEEIEGLASNDASLLDPEGILFTPPDMRSSTQRVFVPRRALQSLEIVAVIHPRKSRRVPQVREANLGLFADTADPAGNDPATARNLKGN